MRHALRLFGKDGEIVSIHAPARGATRKPLKTAKMPIGFNPRTRTGCDGYRVITMERDAEFQSTHPHGVRRKPLKTAKMPIGFNPRTRTGCDLPVLCFVSFHHGFNPRTRTGCDEYEDVPVVFEEVSIHAPARGATTRNF